MTPPQPAGLLNRNVICLWPLREVLLLSPATIPFRVTCRWSKPDGLAATVQTLVSAASRVLISISSTRSVLLANNRTLPVVGHPMTVGNDKLSRQRARPRGHQFAKHVLITSGAARSCRGAHDASGDTGLGTRLRDYAAACAAARISSSFLIASFVHSLAFRRRNLRSCSSLVRAAYHSHWRACSKHSAMVGDIE